MSEDPNTIRVKVEKSDEIKKLQEELEKANKIIEKVAVEKFNDRCAKLGLDPNTTDVETLKAAEALNRVETGEARPAPHGGTTASLTQSQITGEKPQADFNELKDLPLDLIEYESEKQMIEHLRSVASDSSDERSGQAKKALGLLLKKEHEEMSHGLAEYEYSEGVRDLTTRKRGNRKGEWRKVRKTEG